jgi:pyridoxamine 5'-phosphate oxidase
MKFINDEHRDYSKNEFSEKTLNKNPFELFAVWVNDAKSSIKTDYNAFSLSTVNEIGQPSSRIVLLKNFDENGFVFFTNYESRKGKEIEINPNVCMLFFWTELERQIRIQGKVEKISQEESEEYFNTRPYTSKIGAWVSRQSQPLKSRFKLLREVSVKVLQNPLEVPLPPYWGGYRIIPDEFEFWQGRPSRLHDRFRYNLNDGNWDIRRLYP